MIIFQSKFTPPYNDNKKNFHHLRINWIKVKRKIYFAVEFMDFFTFLTCGFQDLLIKQMNYARSLHRNSLWSKYRNFRSCSYPEVKLAFIVNISMSTVFLLIFMCNFCCKAENKDSYTVTVTDCKNLVTKKMRLGKVVLLCRCNRKFTTNEKRKNITVNEMEYKVNVLIIRFLNVFGVL